ncbi:hypothetical protein ACFLXC_04105 [Chloroflexota bacterium]
MTRGILQEVEKPPTVLSMEEYQRDWQPQGWQLIIIGPTSTWRQDWGEWEAIRDIVQNALDECEYYTWGYDSEGLYIRDVGKGIAIADFLLGPPKLKPDHARGKFGEGMKIAALALLRQGYSVKVETKGRKLWIIFLEQKVNGRAQTLAAIWKPNGSTRSGTTFYIGGYKGSAFEDRFAVNLPRSSIVAEAPSSITGPYRRKNQLIKHTFPYGQSRIFARDIYMREINSPYSYNLWSFPLAADRHAPKNEQDLWTDIGRLWSCVTRLEQLKVFLKMIKSPPLLETDESRMVNMTSWDMGIEPVTGKEYGSFVKDNASVWQEAWRSIMGDNAVIRTSDRLDGMVKHLGYQSVSLLWSVTDVLSKIVATDKEIVKTSQERLREVEVIPDDKLERHHLAHLKLARALASRIFFTPPAVFVAVIPPASDRVRTAGMYSTSTGEIYISLEMMERGKTMIDTLVHEMAHHRQYRSDGEAADLTPSHAAAMTVIAAEVVSAIAGKGLDAMLQEVNW